MTTRGPGLPRKSSRTTTAGAGARVGSAVVATCVGAVEVGCVTPIAVRCLVSRSEIHHALPKIYNWPSSWTVKRTL